MPGTTLLARTRRRATGVLAAGALGALTLTATPAHAATAPAATTTATAPAARTTATGTTTRQRIADMVGVALHQVGDPYRYGATGPNSFDCSGLLYFSMHRVGFGRFPRTSSQQAHWGHGIAKRNMRRGDLVFFEHGGRVYHAAIFLGWSHGHAVILHAPRTGERVRVDRPWTSEWFGRTWR
jgi:cell wall-associated NlpC family hydrolase